jgi:DNA polymerase I
MYSLFRNTIMPSHPILIELGKGGIRVDPKRNRVWIAKLERQLDHLNNLWYKHYSPVNPKSSRQLTDLFYKKWGLPVQVSKGDGPTVDELACINLREMVKNGRADAPWRAFPECTPRTFDLLLRIRDVSKNLSTYAKTVIDMKGKIYPQYLPEAKDFESARGKIRKGSAATGRLASRDPNLQNQPEVARLMYIPDYEDWCFVGHDYSAAELRIAAWSSRDRAMLADLETENFHLTGARAIGCERKTYKNVIFGTMYGAGPQKISDTIKKNDGIYVSAVECKRIQNGIAQRYPTLWAWRQGIADRCVSKGYIKNAFGRVRFFYGGNRDIPAALDYIPQSTVADIMWSVFALVANCARKHGGRLTTTVHDSMLAQVPKENAIAYALEVKSIMEREFPNVAPGFFLPVAIQMGAPGASWGEVQEWNETSGIPSGTNLTAA